MHRMFVVVHLHAVLQSADLLQQKLQQINCRVISNDVRHAHDVDEGDFRHAQSKRTLLSSGVDAD